MCVYVYTVQHKLQQIFSPAQIIVAAVIYDSARCSRKMKLAGPTRCILRARCSINRPTGSVRASAVYYLKRKFTFRKFLGARENRTDNEVRASWFRSTTGASREMSVNAIRRRRARAKNDSSARLRHSSCGGADIERWERTTILRAIPRGLLSYYISHGALLSRRCVCVRACVCAATTNCKLAVARRAQRETGVSSRRNLGI